MVLSVHPELGIPIPEDTPWVDLKERAQYACNTAQKLSEHGLETDPTKEDKEVAAKLVISYASDPEKTSKKVTEKKVATLTPASLLMTNSILQEFGQSVVDSAVQIRHMVTNKLVLETDNPDPRVRIRALELLGKISDVGLFSEKTEINVTHTTESLEHSIKDKINRLMGQVHDAEFEEVPTLEITEEKPDASEERSETS